MHVFVTGATGFVGEAVVPELVQAGHAVVGLTRTQAGAAKLAAQGATAVVGDMADLALLRARAQAADGVVHLAFVHDFARFAEACATDRAAISALAEGLLAAERPSDGGRGGVLIGTSGVAALQPAGPGGAAAADETCAEAPDSALGQLRGPSQALLLSYRARGLRAGVVRLAPTTYGPGSSGFVGSLVLAALTKGTSAYVGDGTNTWPAVHRRDAARLYRLALEQGAPGDGVYHAVAQEGVALKDVAAALGRALDVPVVRIAPDQAADHFGAWAFVVHINVRVSSARTQALLGWRPEAPALVDDMEEIVAALKT